MPFSTRYIKFRDSYLPDLYNFRLSERKVEFNNLHFLLDKGSPVSAEVIGKNEIKIDFDADSIKKALVGDIELFRSKVLLQKDNLKKNHKSFTPCWYYVTLYYYSFYNATLLSRFAKNGFIFLNGDKSKYLSEIVTILSSDLVQLNSGNFSFKIEDDPSSSLSSLTLKRSSKNTHEALWHRTNTILNTIKNLENSESLEKLVYNQLSNFNLNPNIHSELRNLINYRPTYALESLKRKIYTEYLIELDDTEIAKKILTIDPFNEQENSKQKMSILTGEFLSRLNEKLYQAYKSRSSSTGLNSLIGKI